MYPPAQEAFPIILGQSWRLMAAGVIAYGVSMSLNVLIFSRLASAGKTLVAVRAAIASVLSQIVDTLIFITVAFLRRPPDRRADRRADAVQGRAVDRAGAGRDHRLDRPGPQTRSRLIASIGHAIAAAATSSVSFLQRFDKIG